MSHKNALKLLAPLALGGVQDADQTVEGEVFDAADTAATEALTEMLPSSGSEEFIAGWEKELGIIPGEDDTLQARRNVVSVRLQEEGGLSAPYFTAMALKLGYDVVIEPIRPLEAGLAQAGQIVWDPRIWTAWIVKVLNHGFAVQDYYRRFGYPLFVYGTAKLKSPVLSSADGPRYLLTNHTQGVYRYDAVTPTGTTTRLNGMAYNGSTYVQVGQSGLIRTSTTAAAGSWVTRTNPVPSAEMHAVVWVPRHSVFIAVGTNSAIITSPDGINWTQQASPSVDSWYCITDNGNTTVIGGSNARFCFMISDITHWVNSFLIAGTHNIVRCLIWTGTLFIAGCEASPTTGLFSSPDGITWANRLAGIPNSFFSLAVLGSTIIATGSNGVLYASTTGTSWTQRTNSGATQSTRAFVANGALILFDAAGFNVQTFDGGATWYPGPTLPVDAVFGMADPANSRRAILLGVNGKQFFAHFGFRLLAYHSSAFRTDVPIPRSWWTFEGTPGATVNDAGGYGNTGTLVGSPTFVQGPIGNAVRLNGSTQYMDCGDVLNVGSGNFWLKAWFRTTDARGGNANGIVWKSGTNGVSDVGYGISLQNGLLRAQLADGTTIRQVFTPGGTLYNNGAWHQVVMTVDRTVPMVRIYADGAQVAATATSFPTGSLSSTQPLRIGFTPGTGGAFNGDLAEVFIGRGAFPSAAQIAAMYASELAGVRYSSAGGISAAYVDTPASLTITGLLSLSTETLNPAGLPISSEVAGIRPGDYSPIPISEDRLNWRYDVVNGPLERTLYALRPAGSNPIFRYPAP